MFKCDQRGLGQKMKICVWGIVVAAYIGILFMSFYYDPQASSLVVFMICVLCILLGYMVCIYKNQEVIIYDDKIKITDLFGRTTMWDWESIVVVEKFVKGHSVITFRHKFSSMARLNAKFAYLDCSSEKEYRKMLSYIKKQKPESYRRK